MAANNNNLGLAKKAKKDEFYTQLPDIEKELRHYENHFRNKVVLCNCDDPKVSNFFVFFVRNFKHLGLKRLITTCYKNNQPTFFSKNAKEQVVYLIYDGGDDNNPDPVKVSTKAIPLQGNGDFRSKECIELLKQSDIVVTNPPFSLFREYVAQLVKYDKKFLIIGNQNAITYKEIFPLIRNNKLWLGYGFTRNCAHFINNSYEDTASDMDHREGMIRVSGVMWFTNMDVKQRHEEPELYKIYTPEEYPKYDNYDAINVNKAADIPIDYDGMIGVPITYVQKHCPDYYDILYCSAFSDDAGIDEGKPDLTIRRYMAEHQHDTNADSERQYFFRVIDWANMLFDGKWKIKKGQPWGELYNLYHMNNYDSTYLHSEVERLLLDDEIRTATGIIRYLLSGEEKYLNLRAFSESQKITLYQRQGGICNICKKPFPIEEMEADHIDPWKENGKTTLENGQMLCRHCNRTKSDK